MFKKRQPQTRRPAPAGSNHRRGVFSYYASRERSEEPIGRQTVTTAARQKRSAWWRHVPTYIAAAAIVISIVYVTSLQTNPKVTHYVNPSEKLYLRDLSVYRTFAQALLEDSLLNRSKLTINTQVITDKIRQQFPELSTVKLTLPFFGRRPILEIEPAVPRLLLVNNSGAFVLDGDGRAIINAKDAPGLSAYSLPSVTDEVGTNVELGHGALPKDNVTFILALLEHLKTKGLTVESLVLPAIANEVHVRITGLPYSIKFFTEGDARQQAGTFFAVKERLEGEGSIPGEYIDVRVEEKAYYR